MNTRRSAAVPCLALLLVASAFASACADEAAESQPAPSGNGAGGSRGGSPPASGGAGGGSGAAASIGGQSGAAGASAGGSAASAGASATGGASGAASGGSGGGATSGSAGKAAGGEAGSSQGTGGKGGDPGSGGGQGGNVAQAGSGGGSATPTDCKKAPFDVAALYAERVGFGRATTGGDPTKVYHVTNLSESGKGSLRDALESDDKWWIVFDVDGKISHKKTPRVKVRSNKTIDGRGRKVTIEGEIYLNAVRNVIFTDVKLTNDLEGHCTQKGDVLSLRGKGADDPDAYETRDIWLNHVEVFNGGDGLVDFRGVSRATISWSHFHTHSKGMLMDKDAENGPAKGMRVTFHHNFFDRLSRRGPQFAYGQAHFFNNYQFEWYEFGAASIQGAQFYSEKNIYRARPGSFCPGNCPDPNPCGDNDYTVSKDALVPDWATDVKGFIKSVDDKLEEGAKIVSSSPEKVFDPAAAYPYTAEAPTDALAAAIKAGAGPRESYCK